MTLMYSVRVFDLKLQGNFNISPHFKVKEFKCKDGCPNVFISLDLLTVLEKIRTELNTPLAINSGFRTYSHNKAVGGAKNSMHMYGLAADVVPKNGDVRGVYNLAVKILKNTGGVGLYDSFVHIDVRSKMSRW